MSIAQIFVTGSGTYPAFTYSWDDVTGGSAATPPDSGTDSVTPTVSVRSHVTSTTRRTVAASVTPALGQPVKLRRHTTTGWHTVRHTTATSTMRFTGVRPGNYRLVVGQVAGSLRTATTFKVR
jgi:hypothetical protein